MGQDAIGLNGYEFDPSFAKDDTRTLAQYLAGQTRADDVIFLDAPEPLGYYYHGPAALISNRKVRVSSGCDSSASKYALAAAPMRSGHFIAG